VMTTRVVPPVIAAIADERTPGGTVPAGNL
jgi:hypothetical protein